MAAPIKEITLRIEQRTRDSEHHTITLALERPGESRLTATAEIEFALTPQEHAELRWYLEDYLQRAESVTAEHVEQIESIMRDRGVELFEKILEGNRDARRIFDRAVDHIADLRVEITTSVADAAAIPWELMFDPSLDSAIALRVKSFVRVQSEANLSFVQPPDTDEFGRVRLLYVVCRPSGTEDVALRAVVNQLLQTLEKEKNLDRFDITALRPPTYEQLQQELASAKAAGRPYHIVHFDGHGIYADLEKTTLADWAALLSSVMLKADSKGPHGYLLFEHPDSEDKMRPVSGDQLGKLLHDNGVPVLVLNACQSAMHEATSSRSRQTSDEQYVNEEHLEPPNSHESGYHDVHDEVRAIGSLSQAVVDQGIPAVLGMRYSVFVVTAAQFIGRVYSALAAGRGFGQAATEGRKHLHANPERWVGLQPRPLQDWFVPVVFEADQLQLFEGVAGVERSEPPADDHDAETGGSLRSIPAPHATPATQTTHAEKLREKSRAAAAQLDPVQNGSIDVKYVPDTGFVGRDETLLLLDRAFDTQRVVLLHAYAGQGKTTTAVEFARWYATTGGLGDRPNVLLTSFETTTTLRDVLDTIGQAAVEDWAAVNRLEERQQRVLAVLRSVPLLWIWDNIEPVAGFPAGTESSWTDLEQRELADFLKRIKLDSQSRAKVLLTSRRDEQAWLGGIPYRVPMPRMRPSDAARLAQQLGAERKLTRVEINSWQPLLDYCAGNPLTLRVIVGQAVRMGLRGEDQITAFVQAVRDGEQQIEDADEAQGRDVSLGASLDYGFKNAFNEDELPIVALLHLFQGVVDVDVLAAMGKVGEHALPEIAAWVAGVERSEPPADDHDAETGGSLRSTPATLSTSATLFTSLLDRCRETGLLTHLGSTWYTIHPALPWFLRQLFARHYPTVTRRDRDVNDVTLPPGGSRGTSGEGPPASSSDPATMMPTPSPAATASDPPGGRVKKEEILAEGLAEASGYSGTRSTATAALRAWVEAVGELSNHYWWQFNEGNRDVIQPLVLEESNLLHARRVSRRHGWWPRVTSAMQGLRTLYQYQGRLAEWSRLVTEIVPDYCTDADDPVPGREDAYSLVMGYRVDLARDHHRDLPQAARLQEKRVAWDRQQAAAALALPPDAPLDADQRNRIRTLGVSVFTLGQILMEQGSGDCVPAYEETVRYTQRIGDTAGEAISHYNIGHAYKDLPDIRDLDAAEAAYQRSLDLFEENDLKARSACLQQIGMVHHERFKESRAALVGRTAQSVQTESTDGTASAVRPTEEEVLRHAQAAESHYHQSLALCPATAITDLGPIHNQLGNLYDDVGQTEQAREHYEKAAQCFEQSGNRFHAGTVRRNIALMYLSSASRESTSSGRETLLRRAQTYAAAALRDFQHYEGRAADMEAKCRQLIDDIQQQLP